MYILVAKNEKDKIKSPYDQTQSMYADKTEEPFWEYN